MESVFTTVKSELGEHFDSHGDAKMELFDCQISLAAFERRAMTHLA